jgi:DNA-binding transcriptional MerR regulator
VGYSIAHAAEKSGLSIDTLRYYERIGLIEAPARDAGGRRSYTDAANHLSGRAVAVRRPAAG